MLTIDHISMEFSSRPVLDDITFLINRKERIALAVIGRNWNFWALLISDFALATALTMLLWRIINKKMANDQIANDNH